MLGRLTSLLGALLVITGASENCFANDKTITLSMPHTASVLQLPNDETMIRLGVQSEAILPVSSDQTLIIRRTEGRLIAELAQNDDPESIVLIDQEAVATSDRSTEVRLVDANFDGVRDLMVETRISYGGVNVFFKLLLGTETGFDARSAQSDLSNPEIDPVLKQIRTSMRSGPTWHLSVYEVEDERPYLHMTAVAAGEGVEYVQFLSSDGSIDREMITDALADDPNDWKPISLKLPKGALFPLRNEPNLASSTTDALPENSTVMLRKLSKDKLFTLVEHSKTGVIGWLKTEWLPMPEGLQF
ncbi:MAG: hypothetical protein AB8B94_07580 [Hyphomicrobiales bacterium]